MSLSDQDDSHGADGALQTMWALLPASPELPGDDGHDSDGEFHAALAAVPASPELPGDDGHDSDADIAVMLDMIREEERQADRYKQRGPLLCHMMRRSKAVGRKLGTVVSIANI